MCFHLLLVFFVVLMSPVMSVRFSYFSLSLLERERVRVAVVLDESCPVSVCLCVCSLYYNVTPVVSRATGLYSQQLLSPLAPTYLLLH